MFPNKIDSRYIKKGELRRVTQGDILRNTKIIDYLVKDKTYEIAQIELPYAVIMTQDCDLEQDYNNRRVDVDEKQDKYLQSILICPAYQSEIFKDGKHLEDLYPDIHLTMEKWDSGRFKTILNQNNHRYYFLEQFQNFQIPSLVVDFKHYHTISREFLYKIYPDCYLATLNQLFREDISQRFSNYLSRIGLPNI
jgi:hypothetical protein